MSRVILYIATSLDGFIADKKGSVDWLPHPDDKKDEFGYKDLLERIETIVMGSLSYNQILGFGDWAWKDKTTYVFMSNKAIKPQEDNILFVHDDVKTFMNKFKEERPNQDIWLLGGAKIAKSFALERLIDECIITIIPKILIEGIKLDLPYEDFTLVNRKTFGKGIVQEFYNINR